MTTCVFCNRPMNGEPIIEGGCRDCADKYHADEGSAGLRNRIAELETQLAERDAQCAAMREVLENATGPIAWALGRATGQGEKRWAHRFAEVQEASRAARASDAGTAMLERALKAESDLRRLAEACRVRKVDVDWPALAPLIETALAQ